MPRERRYQVESLPPYAKLPFAKNPGALISPAFAETFAKGLKDCRVAHLSSGIQYLQRIILMLSAPLPMSG